MLWEGYYCNSTVTPLKPEAITVVPGMGRSGDSVYNIGLWKQYGIGNTTFAQRICLSQFNPSTTSLTGQVPVETFWCQEW
jgi:hypothetical protein